MWTGFLGELSLALPLWRRAAEAITRIVWMEEERRRMERFRGEEERRCMVLKKMAPRRKEEIAVRDFWSWNFVVPWGRLERLRAAKIVLPVLGLLGFVLGVRGIEGSFGGSFSFRWGKC